MWREERIDFKCWTITCHLPWLLTQHCLWYLSYWTKKLDINYTFVICNYSFWKKTSPSEDEMALRKSKRTAHLSSAVNSSLSSLGRLFKGASLSFRYKDAERYLLFHRKKQKWNSMFSSSCFLHSPPGELTGPCVLSPEPQQTTPPTSSGVSCCDYVVWHLSPNQGYCVIFFWGIITYSYWPLQNLV